MNMRDYPTLHLRHKFKKRNSSVIAVLTNNTDVSFIDGSKEYLSTVV
jgi:hypothetical protein